MKTTLKILRVLALMLALMLPQAGTVHAANLTVTKTTDTNDEGGGREYILSPKRELAFAPNG